ncbi:MAG TPA: LysR family transcriptional regulator [Acidimicrobiales bacterium]|nr:LysR family transcriptional regulator [Acidimicrobiales bacterium]
MEIRDLRALLAVVRCGSFTAAARELGYTQSAISQQVAALEREVGHQLVQRRPVRATAAGERLAEHAARILLRLDVARSELSHLGTEPMEVRVAACPLAAPQLLAAALREVRSLDPRLGVTVHLVEAATAVAEVATGAVDAALVDGIAAPNEPLHLADAGLLSSTAMTEAGLAVALPSRHPLQERASLDLAVLADAPWIVAPALTGTSIYERPPVAAGRGSRVVYEGSDLLTLLALVAAGLGVALLPRPACAGVDGICSVPLSSPRLVHRTELLALRTVTPRQQQVIETLRSRASLA